MEEELYKIVFVGGNSAGKSKLLLRMKDGVFNDGYQATIGIDFAVIRRTIGGRTIKLQLWDCAGQERFAAITRAYYRGASVIAIVHDLTKEDVDISENFAQQARQAAPEAKIVLIGNKVDLKAQRQASLDTMLNTAMKIDATYVEVSVLTGEGVEDAVQELVRVARSSQ